MRWGSAKDIGRRGYYIAVTIDVSLGFKVVPLALRWRQRIDRTAEYIFFDDCKMLFHANRRFADATVKPALSPSLTLVILLAWMTGLVGTPSSPGEASWSGSAAVAQELSDLDSPFGAQAANPVRTESNLVFREVDGKEIHADLFRPADEREYPLVVMIHGGAWSAGDKRELRYHAIEMAQAGFVALAINYRLAPWVQMDAQLEDCRYAVRWAVEQASQWDADSTRLAIWGYSAGAHLASLLALNPKPGDPEILAVVAGGPPCDFSFVPAESKVLSHVLGGSRAEVPEIYDRFSPTKYVHADAPPFFIFHGSADLLVPQTCSKTMYELLKESGAETEFYSVEGKGHLLAFLDLKARRKAIDFLLKHLEEVH